ncbi:hypothetical protein I350_02052 [Cryptococcus amylolentus CBS 6273]|uniref:Anaphase-promoting complex subunit 3 n=1 Tax=Cryptococcus amylolentus CBS 6273 TaxID=1296118 RepID=A0A1E3KAG4_9TREE|nr:hypothetical protein I350_02052 [Cryptococcus amylolentus CBS 6273]
MSAHVHRRLAALAASSPPPSALFYARLFHALAPGLHDAAHALALAFLANHQPYSAIHLLRDSTGLESLDQNLNRIAEPTAKPCYACALIVAKACDHLGRYTEGQAVLARALKRCPVTNIIFPSPVSSPATAHLLLATLSQKSKATETAVDSYKKALEEDPWLWEAFTGLCDIGAHPSVEQLFPIPTSHPLSRSNTSRSSRPPLSPNLHRQKSPADLAPGILRAQGSGSNGNSNVPSNGGGLFTPDVGGAERKLGMLGNTSAWDTSSVMGDSTFALTSEPQSKRPFPTFMSQATSFLPSSLRGGTSTPANPNISDSPPKLQIKRARGKDVKKAAETPQNQMGPLARELRPNGAMRGLDDDGIVRRSSRLKTGTAKPIATKPTARSVRSRSAASSASTDIPSPPASAQSQSSQAQAQMQAQAQAQAQEALLQSAADDYLRDIVRKCAKAYRSLSMYQCEQALKDIDLLPNELKTSAWALDILGRAFYEMANYTMARQAFAFLQQLEPYRLQSMEQYSTLLWHLDDLPMLSHLSQTLISISRTSPQAWIAIGNSFSLKGEHDEAMRCFRRATQVDPGCAYAWTLCGYEAVEMEEFERALAFYRTAIRTDTRHYNAWYGMGLVYLKTDKPAYAEHHFKRAVEINPSNAVLLCCVGMALEKSDDIVQAIHYYELASRYAPHSPMVQFKRIRALVSLQRYDEAILALEPLTHTAPDEANVFFLLGKCYLKRDRRAEATKALTMARELAPKLEGAINSVFLANGDELEEED